MSSHEDRDVKNIGIFSIRTINKVRSAVNIEPISRGYRKCLRCDKEFFSLDLKSNKMCSSCGFWGASNDTEGA